MATLLLTLQFVLKTMIFLLLAFFSSPQLYSIVTFFFFHFTQSSKIRQLSIGNKSRDLESDCLLLNPSFSVYY